MPQSPDAALELGYALSSEEFGPADLVRFAHDAEAAGFGYGLISDHYHPWIDRQGQSPFVWSVIGGVAQATSRFRLGTGVTCPLVRIHPAVVAQAAATAAAMMPRRFFLGVGIGEYLNEHIAGAAWPPSPERLEMLEEAVRVIRLLWQGGVRTHRGRYYTVEEARIYTLPAEGPPPIMVAASATRAAELAGRIGDGLISTGPNRDVVDAFERAGGAGKPRYGELTVCWAPTAEDARRVAHRQWPTAAFASPLNSELRTPAQFDEVAAQMVTEADVASQVVCGPDPAAQLGAIRKYAEAGFDHVYVHQVGPDQAGFLNFYRSEILPAFRRPAPVG
jgi:coenzyme F420-dependent glucose-6-phosphate dehydrogenase